MHAPPGLAVTGDADLIAAALMNLLDNATRHGAREVGVSVTGGMEAIRHGGQAASFAAGGAALAWGGARAGTSAYSDARAAGSGCGAAALKGMSSGVGAASGAVASAARDKAIGVPGTWGASTLGLANAKLDQSQGRAGSRPNRDEKA